jgi:adenine phosphoribosyltransferase
MREVPALTLSPPVDLRRYIRDIPDFPKRGIMFRDITPLLADPGALRHAVDALAEPFRDEGIDQVLGIESRGFIFGAPVALALGAGGVVVRKAGKLPHRTLEASYDLEYGKDTVEIHADALHPGQKVLIVDDLIATGGTAAAAVHLASEAKADVVACAFLIELRSLGGRERLGVEQVHTLLEY